jgi:chemotaxis protein CheY-P-specific phosphatase CheC
MQASTTLNEIAKISTLKAISVLSRFLQRPVGVAVDAVETNYLEELYLFDHVEETIVSTLLPIKGEVDGAALLIYPYESMLSMCDILLNRATGQTQFFKEKEMSILSEIATICIGSFLAAFAQALQLHLITHQVAIFDHGPGTHLQQKIASLFLNHPRELVTKCSFNFQICHAKGSLIILLEQREINASLRKLSDNVYLRIHQ